VPGRTNRSRARSAAQLLVRNALFTARLRRRPVRPPEVDPPATEATRALPWLLRSGGAQVALDGPASLLRRVAELFETPLEPAAGDRPHLRAVGRDGGAGWELSVEGEAARPVDRWSLAGPLLPPLTTAQLAAEPGWSHLHAGAAVRHGRAIVVPGASGAGKSVLTVLLAHGHGLLSDEVVAIDRAQGVLRATPRPVSIKVRAHGPLTDVVPDDAPRDRQVWLAPSEVGTTAAGAVAPGLVVLPARDEGAEHATFEPIQRAEALEGLLANAFDLPRRPEERLADLAWLVASSAVGRLRYAEAADAVGVLDALAGADGPPVAAAAPVLVPVADGGDGPRRSAEALSVVLDGRAVILHRTSRAVARLDPAGTELWLRLDGRPHDAADPAFLAELDDLDLIEGDLP